MTGFSRRNPEKPTELPKSLMSSIFESVKNKTSAEDEKSDDKSDNMSEDAEGKMKITKVFDFAGEAVEYVPFIPQTMSSLSLKNN